MSTRRISQVAEDWNIPDPINEEVRGIIFDQLNFEHGYNPVELYDVFDGDPPKQYELEVEPGEYMNALSSLDGRNWHERQVDLLTHKYEDILESSDYDVMIRDLDLNHSDENYKASYAPVESRRVLKELRLPITDIDFAMVAFTEDEILIDFWDIKTRGSDLQDSDLEDKIDSVSEEVSIEDVKIDPSCNKINSQQVGLELDEMGVETLPNHYSGDYRFANDFQPETDREALNLFVNSFLGYDSVDELEEISRR